MSEKCPNCNGTGCIGPTPENVRHENGAVIGNCDRCSGTGLLNSDLHKTIVQDND